MASITPVALPTGSSRAFPSAVRSAARPSATGINHTTWNAGLDYSFTKNIALDARYYDTNSHSLGDTYGSHYVAAIKFSF